MGEPWALRGTWQSAQSRRAMDVCHRHMVTRQRVLGVLVL